jgi:hypothetical protein
MPYRIEISQLVDLFNRRFVRFLSAWGITCRYSRRNEREIDYHIWRLYPFYDSNEHGYHLVFVIARLPSDKILIENNVASDIFSPAEIRNIWASFFERAREVASELLLTKINSCLTKENILPMLNVIKGTRRVQEITAVTPSGKLVSVEFFATGENIFLKPEGHPPIRVSANSIPELVDEIRKSISLLML